MSKCLFIQSQFASGATHHALAARAQAAAGAHAAGVTCSPHVAQFLHSAQRSVGAHA